MDIQNPTLETVKGEVMENKDDNKEIVTENSTEVVDVKKTVTCETDSIVKKEEIKAIDDSSSSETCKTNDIKFIKAEKDNSCPETFDQVEFVAKDPSCEENLSELSDVCHEDDRKIFIGGLPQEAKEADIRDYFISYGDIESITLKKDPCTDRSRGFCFLIFKSIAGIDAVLKHIDHVIKGKKVSCSKAQARQGKIYVGNLPAGNAVSKESLRDHFKMFGSVLDVSRPIDKAKDNEPKSFAFITFAREESAKRLIKEGQTTINGVSVVIKSVSQKQPKKSGIGWQGFGGYGSVMDWGYGDPNFYRGFPTVGYGNRFGLYGEGWMSGYGNSGGGKMSGFSRRASRIRGNKSWPY